MAAYSRLLLAPAEGWWPSANWLGYPHPKFQNNPVIFYWFFYGFLKKMGQLGSPKHPFLSLDKKIYFTNHFYLG